MSVETGSAEEPSTTFENAPNLEPTDAIDPKAAEGEAQVHPVVDEEQSREILPPNNINEIVIEIQQKDGTEVSPAWWAANIDQDGTEQEMLAQFLEAYERDFPRGADGVRQKAPGVV